MSNLKYEVWHYPKNETGSYNLTTAVDLSNDDGINSSAGIYAVTLSNRNSALADEIRYGDKLKLKAGYEGETLQIIEYGKIEDEEYTISNNRRTKTVKGYGASREFQNFLANQVIKSGTSIEYQAGNEKYSYNKINSRNMVKVLVAQHIIANDGPTIDYSTYVDTGSLCEPWAHTVGSNFFKVWVNTPVGRCIDEIRTDKYTGAGDYDFYLDNEYKLHFEPRGKSASDVTLTEGSNIISYTMKRSIKPKYTGIIVFCGRDQDGIGVYGHGVNSNAVTQYGLKWGYANYGMLWNNASGEHAGEAWSVIREAAKSNGDAIATSIAINQGLPRWEGNFTLRGTTQFSLSSGQYVNVNLPSVSTRFSPGSMSLTDVKQSLNNRGWTTTITLEEKDGEIFG